MSKVRLYTHQKTRCLHQLHYFYLCVTLKIQSVYVGVRIRLTYPYSSCWITFDDRFRICTVKIILNFVISFVRSIYKTRCNKKSLILLTVVNYTFLLIVPIFLGIFYFEKELQTSEFSPYLSPCINDRWSMDRTKIRLWW